MNPTAEQSNIIFLAQSSQDNLLINALAGCGKTSTLELIHSAISTNPILFLAFNKRIVTEMESRLAERAKINPRLPQMTIRTFNSLGHRIWGANCSRNLKIDPKKSQNLFRAIIDTMPKTVQKIVWESYHQVVEGVALAKSLGYIPDFIHPNAIRLINRKDFHASLEERPDDLTADLIDAILKASIKGAYEGLIDFNDQIYMPALFGGTFPRFPLVCVDEVQDLNPVNHAMLTKLCRNRIIAVGDPWQSIYGFRGAKQGGMQYLQKKFEMIEADLSVSFRCPQAIVEAVRWRVPHFQWVKEGGQYAVYNLFNASEILDGSTIISRNNAPLFKTALHLLSSGRSVSVAGSDIGPKIVGLMRKLGPEDTSKAGTIDLIAGWEAERLAKESKTAKDIADCMRVFASFGNTLGQAVIYAEHLFKQEGSIRLLTGHKAKGLEWDTIYHLDPDLLDDDEQDLNLRYVITTRAKQSCYEITSSNIQW